jgi:hypothetical protein
MLGSADRKGTSEGEQTGALAFAADGAAKRQHTTPEVDAQDCTVGRGVDFAGEARRRQGPADRGEVAADAGSFVWRSI